MIPLFKSWAGRLRALRPAMAARPLPWAIGAMAALLLLKAASLVLGTHAPVTGVALAAGHEAEPPKAAAPAPRPAPPPPPPAEPAISEAEKALLLDLRARRAELDKQQTALDERQAVLAAAEKRLAGRVAELAAVQTKLEALEKTRQDRDEANWRSLVKTYETMRPRDAATIFNDLDQAVLIPVLDRMKEAKAGAILAAMLPERARWATAQLAQYRNRATDAKPE